MFPIFDYTLPALVLLPVEMLALVLRYLDPESLLNAALSSRHFMRVCRGDPILREKMRLQIKKEKDLSRRATLDAKIGVCVSRSEQSRIFSTNAQKYISMKNVPRIKISSRSAIIEPKSFSLVPEKERKKGGGKIRRLRIIKREPYKNIRL